MRRWLVRLAFLVGLGLLWQALAAARVWSPVLLPSPTAVLAWLGDAARDGTLLAATTVTLRRLALGFAVGVGIGLPIGLLCARSRSFDDTVGLLARGAQSLPSVCWAPLAILWFTRADLAMLFVVVMGTVGSIAIATADGVRAVPPIYVRVARTMGASGVATWLRVVLPASLPFVVSGMKQGWAFAWRSLMAAEIIVPGMQAFGLGHLLHYGRELHAMDQVLGVMIVIVVVGVTIDRVLFAAAERALHRRWGTGRSP